ncbi:DNA primase [Lichenibacterium dinghuense]|uniref:DNA primase n=1 Tax=Lichenibacterium dinghuense TaxID=2895977 RepID=UPI001F023904|nr:DNA primase [Lichenibacterium sp. 6Y81]
MRFTPEFLDEIKNRVNVSDVVGRRVRLKKEGREWRGLSPFNSEKTPSFFVNDAKMAWFDFSSGRNGNIFDFVMATDGLSFPEAVEALAGEAGLDMPKATAASVEREKQRAGLVEVMEWAAQFFEGTLKGSRGQRGRDYIASRAIAPAVQVEFRLGYAPGERYALRDHLASKGASAEVMCEAGLLNHGEGIAVPYDKFRDRVIFPIQDRSGRVIAFGGRALEKDVPAKYLNSPETPLFHKGHLLYNHHRARKAAQERGQGHGHGTVISVEGYIDVIAMHAAGFPNVVAGLGTALTIEQCELLWRMSPEPILCFDGDGAGRRAAAKALDTALPALTPEKTLRFAFLPDGQDPDDLAKSGGGGAIAAVLAQAKPLVDVLWSREVEATTLDTPERRAGLKHRLGELARQIGDETLRRYYGQELYGRLDALTGNRRGDGPGHDRRGAGAPQNGRPGRPASPFPPPGRPRFGSPPPLRGYRGSAPAQLSAGLSRGADAGAPVFQRREVEILAIVMNHPALLDHHAEGLSELDFEARELAGLRDRMVELLSEHVPDHGSFKAALDARGAGDLRRRVQALAERAPLWSTGPAAAPEDAELSLLQAMALHRKARDLHRDLQEARDALARDPSEVRWAELQAIQAHLTTLEGTEAMVEGYGTLSGQKHAAD